MKTPCAKAVVTRSTTNQPAGGSAFDAVANHGGRADWYSARPHTTLRRVVVMDIVYTQIPEIRVVQLRQHYRRELHRLQNMPAPAGPALDYQTGYVCALGEALLMLFGWKPNSISDQP
ncbi:MAG: hypothetical protein JO211_17050 [Acidobacteriaceae bacterium]|nr:hypothetical protein [Acidobacteriaceae bacterium]